MSLADLFARKRAEREAEIAAQDAWEKTPEGAAWRAQQDDHHRRMREADERYAAEHPEPEADDPDGEESDDPEEES